MSPHLLNEIVTKQADPTTKSPDPPKIFTQIIKKEVQSPTQPVIQQIPGNLPSKTMTKQKTSPQKTISPSGAVTKEKITDKLMTQQKVVDIDKVLNIMTRQISNVKRRSVQAEVLNIYQRVALQLKGPETIVEENDDVIKGDAPDVTVTMATETNVPVLK